MAERRVAPSVVPRWVAIGFLLGAVGLIPEIVRLVHDLPLRHIELHWRLVWIGYDLVMVFVFLISGILLLRRSPWVATTVSVAGTLLLADAWFDVMTSRGAHQVVTSMALAVLLEIPLGVICFFISGRYLLNYIRLAAAELASHEIGSTAP